MLLLLARIFYSLSHLLLLGFSTGLSSICYSCHLFNEIDAIPKARIFFFNFSTFFEHFGLSLLGFLFYMCIFFISTIKSHSLRQDTKFLLFCFPHQLEYCTLFSEFLYDSKFSVPNVAQVRSSLLLCYMQHMVRTFNIHLITYKIKLKFYIQYIQQKFIIQNFFFLVINTTH